MSAVRLRDGRTDEIFFVTGLMEFTREDRFSLKLFMRLRTDAHVLPGDVFEIAAGPLRVRAIVETVDDPKKRAARRTASPPAAPEQREEEPAQEATGAPEGFVMQEQGQ